MTKLILTGAGGFAGHHFLEHVLATTDWDIICTDSFRHRGKTDRINEVLAGHDGWRRRTGVITHDLSAPFSQQAFIRMAGEEPVDYVIAYASESHVERSITDPVPFVMNNVSVALNTLEMCRALKPEAVVLVSTDEVYGPQLDGQPPHPEWSPVLPSNPYCLLPGTDVVTRRGLVPIEEFDPVHHRVISRDESKDGTPDGLARRTWKYVTCKPVLRIRTREGAEEIGCTPEHRFFVRVNSHTSGGSRIEERRAKDIRPGDRICLIRRLPFPQDLKPVQAQYARFLGYWLADGSYAPGSQNQYVRLADQKREYIDFYREQAREAFGVSLKSATGAFGNVYKHGSKDCWYLQFTSEAQRQLIDLSDKLNVVEQALNFPEQALGQFIAGWLDGDGSIAREGSTVICAEISAHDIRLRRQLKFLLRRLGVIAADSEVSRKVRVTDSRSLQLLRSLAPSRKWQDTDGFRVPQRKPGRAKNWVWARVDSITEEPYDGKVYDLEVPVHHNYTANYFLTHNSASKAAQEAIATAYWRTYGVPVIIIQCMNMFGERQDPEKFIPMVIGTVQEGRTVSVHGAPADVGTRHYLHARNLADGIMFLLRDETGPAVFPAHQDKLSPKRTGNRPDRYNIASADRIDNLAMAQAIAGYAGGELRYQFTDFHATRPGHDPHYGLDPAKMTALGWKPPVPFAESLERTVKWTLAHPAWMVP